MFMTKKLNWFEYYIGHCFQTGWREMWNNFKMWRDLISGNYENYALLKDDDPYEECYQWFWTSINLDETYPKEFLEYLQQMVDDIESGKVKTVPFTQDMFDEIDNLVGDLIEEKEDGDV
jgi:hypothetical protein